MDIVEKMRPIEASYPEMVEMVLNEREAEISRLRQALKYCVKAIAEYEKDPTDLSLRPWLLGAMDHAKKILENKDG